MAYFCVQPTNRPTKKTQVLIISNLHFITISNHPNQPDQPA